MLHLKDAANMLNHTMDILTWKRNSANKAFYELFVEATELCDYLDIPIKIPRTIIMSCLRETRELLKEDDDSNGRIYQLLQEWVIFPLTHRLLFNLLTLPVSVATKECSFSALWHLKTWIRSGMGQQRLMGLALLHVHLNIYIDPQQVIRFAEKRTHRQ
ncbi:hypothetical protein PR048_011162 [Dryococelus australis]|uniref:HAT C-terminal dimerisation domain-containing protein n=1 Tax=Dryococelus australis TaxID=614101 RepID=A0ABQ9HKV3_9NEOP|nr:hypothetical protein PR048_011162 [Dryococelus australis]